MRMTVLSFVGREIHLPRGAQVQSVDVNEEEPEGLSGFSMR